MLMQLPRLTSSLRGPFDTDQAYLQRKAILQNYLKKPNNAANSLYESELASKILDGWEGASTEVRHAYKQFIGGVVELIDGEVQSEEFREVALNVYRIFGKEESADNNFTKKKSKLQKLIGHAVSDAKLQKVAALSQRLCDLKPGVSGAALIVESHVNGSGDDLEFGADLAFQAPARFLVDTSLEDGEMLGEESAAPSSMFRDGWYDHGELGHHHFTTDGGNFDLSWLRDACDQIIRESTSQLSKDDLAMAICRVLDSDKPGEEIAGDLLDLVGDSAFEIVQDLILHRKELVDAIHRGLSLLKSDKMAPNTQSRMPSYGTQVTIQTESAKQIDKLRRKEEKRNRRGTEYGVESDVSAASFSSLLQASERKNPFDNLIGSGSGPHSLSATALPQGTIRKHYKGYEEVIIPPTPTTEMKPGEKLIEIKELDDFAQAAFHGYKSLNRIQSWIFQTVYYTNENILVCAPTGAGKTNIAMISILHEIGQHFKDGYLHKDEFKIVYVAPMKALAAEVTSAFSRRLSPLNMTVRELTGDMQLSKSELEETQMIVTTPEKWDVITRKSSDMSLSMLVKLLIIDEVHLLNDDRGPVIEALVARTLRQVESTQTMIRIVGLSATLPNYLEVAQFLRVSPETGLFFFDSSYRPVPLAQQYIGISEQNFAARNDLLNEICYKKIVDSLRQGHQAMVFVHSRKDTTKTAGKLKEVMKSRNKDLVELFESGVGAHHAGTLRADRGLTERLFSYGLLKIFGRAGRPQFDKSGEGIIITSHDKLACYLRLLTSQLPIESQGIEYYDGKAKRYVDFPITDMLQMMGGAGRPQYDQHGKAVILVHEPKKSFYKKFLYEPFPVESSLREQLHEHINAEIVTGTICHKEDAMHHLTWTYLFRRLMVNPAYYGLENAEAEMLNSYLSRLVQTTFEDLEDSGCIKMDEENVEPLVLGTIASQYYLSYMTVSMFGSNIGPDTSLEENYSEALSGRVRYMVDKNALDDPHFKANLLFQAHFSQLELPISDYVTDLKSVLDQSIRIIQAMIDICANSGWLSASVTCMHLLQMVMQGIWFDKDSSLQMLPCMNEDLLQSLRQRGISTVQQLLDLPGATLQSMSGNFPASRFYQDLQNFPCIRMKLKVEKKDIDGRKSLTLKIKLEKTNREQNRSRAFTPRFPKVHGLPLFCSLAGRTD